MKRNRFRQSIQFSDWEHVHQLQSFLKSSRKFMFEKNSKRGGVLSRLKFGIHNATAIIKTKENHRKTINIPNGFLEQISSL